jgi:hypothetical protein
MEGITKILSIGASDGAKPSIGDMLNVVSVGKN